MSDNAIKLIGIVIYLAVLLYIGVLASRRMKDVRDYFAGGKDMGFWAVAFSARATGESAWLLLGLTGMGATVGLQSLWVVLGEVVGVGGAWLLMARRFKRLTDRYDSLTIPDYLESRFRDRGHVLRLVSAGALVVFVTIYVSAQIDATGKAFESFLDWNYYVGIAVGFAVVLAYIVSGGFVAVVWSDVFQGALMVAGMVLLPAVALWHAGGLAPVLDGLRAQDPSLLEFSFGHGTEILGTLALLLIGLGFLGSPQIFVRFIALRSESELRRGAAVALCWTLLADTGAVLTGLVGRHLLVGSGPSAAANLAQLGDGGEAVLPALVEHVMPIVIVGLFIAIVLSAIMSTVDSLLVVASSAVVRDWYQKVRAPHTPDDALVGRSRLATFVLAFLALAIALGVAFATPKRTVFWFVIFGWSGIAATFCPTMILSLWWSRMTARGALAAMVTGFVSVPLFKFAAPALPEVGDAFAKLSELPPAFAASMVAGVLVSVLDGRGRERARESEDDLRDAAS
ncbi:sodium/proline symporter [Paraliomyxa miuraensis]|uniref:sodium/proline symporter n=1 Tax=Paraliomyxa miuraensis TaxID=376150 RepID=UPI002256C101|nr:sodium/proline symporter [Paraliomyxa miuraensis]MCX4242220.1 sodium/proline symporter [Paraliomyxa miuraensis]